MLASCGEIFSLKNDTQKVVYVDVIYTGHERRPDPQELIAGQFYSAPSCWKEVAAVYVGNKPEEVKMANIEHLCSPSSCRCIIDISKM